MRPGRALALTPLRKPDRAPIIPARETNFVNCPRGVRGNSHEQPHQPGGAGPVSPEDGTDVEDDDEEDPDDVDEVPVHRDGRDGGVPLGGVLAVQRADEDDEQEYGPERDVEALADRLARLLEDSKLRARMGRAARLKMEAEYDIRLAVEQLERHYDEVCLKRP